MTDIPATYGKLEFGASKGMRKRNTLPIHGWYVWPSDINSLEAWMCGALFGPFAGEDEACAFAATKCFEKVTR